MILNWKHSIACASLCQNIKMTLPVVFSIQRHFEVDVNVTNSHILNLRNAFSTTLSVMISSAKP